eukprot:CAMPEP_0181441084 /NCGR_PEP_ID=MMETSP1110-20121109/23318_1 /TAXON_ID=174948 /ORGANISM="Symbiodinium sp., Strain CCMP421" /LENGTH=40 /DNA_ID= /DNA_START= /DNA_END= /DNA_ORIENTATION=
MAPGCYASHCNEFLLTSLVAGGGGERTVSCTTSRSGGPPG